MAKLLWGRVYFKDIFAGILKQEPGEVFSFAYDDSYLNEKLPSISFSILNDKKTHFCQSGLHPFFDNLIAEGWLEKAQSRLLGKREISRFEILLAFGYDCAGAVSIIDPEPEDISDKLIDINNQKELALLKNRASLSGVQPKITIIKKENKYFPSTTGELSSHIAKFSSSSHLDLVINEYITINAFKSLLPDSDIVNISIDKVEEINATALIIERFDRKNGERIHFEEFNQLLELKPSQKYTGSYKDMADFISSNKECIPVEKYKLFERILCGILIGNTDMHFKNFAMFYEENSLRLTPSYDQVCAYLYDYKSLALSIGNTNDLMLNNLKPKNILILGKEFGFSNDVIMIAINKLNKNMGKAIETINNLDIDNLIIKNKIIEIMEKRWKTTFALIGKTLLKKQ